MRALLDRVFLVVGFSPFITLNISCHSLLACRVSAEKSADNLMGIPLYVVCCFSLVAFNIFSFYLIFVSLINMCFGLLFGCILDGTLCTSWSWVTVSFPTLGKFLAIISSNRRDFYLKSIWNLLRPFLFLFFFWDPSNANVGVFNVVPEVSETVLIFFSVFNIHLFIWLYQVLVVACRIFIAACRIFSCGMWDI